MNGSREIEVAGITLACISPEARDLLDAAMEGWNQHRQQLPPEYETSVYSFAYWLIRYSGLVEPARKPTVEASPSPSPSSTDQR